MKNYSHHLLGLSRRAETNLCKFTKNAPQTEQKEEEETTKTKNQTCNHGSPLVK